MCRECAKNYDCLKKLEDYEGINQGLPRWQRDALPLSYARTFIISKTSVFLKIWQVTKLKYLLLNICTIIII